MNDILMNGTYIKDEEFYNFNFSTNLSVANKARFVNSVVDLVVDDKYYDSVVRDIVFDFFVISIFTDIDVEEMLSSPTFFDDVEQFLNETNIVEIVKANAAPNLFAELNEAVGKSIEYRTGIHTNPFNEALASLVSTFEKKVNEFDLSSAMEMVQKFTNMTGDSSPESIMRNIVNAYMESDIHKQNIAEIKEVKDK